MRYNGSNNIFIRTFCFLVISKTGGKMEKVLRQEKKYLLNCLEFRKYSNFLEQILMNDPHNGCDGYIVRSLYFDTLDNKDFYLKEMGVEIRRKIRLRVYDPSDEFAMLEIKQKEGDDQLKRSLRISKEDALEMIQGKYECLLKYKEDFALECYTYMISEGYVPTCVVQYNRKAFICKENKTRITFDSNIVATEANFNIFDSNLVMYPVFPKFNVVLEVKYNSFLLGYVKDFLREINKSQISASKYCLARKVSLNYNYI